MRIGTIFCVAVLVFTAACARTQKVRNMSPEQRSTLDRIEVYFDGDEPSRPYQLVQTIQGISCFRNAKKHVPVSVDYAVEHLKWHATKKRADAVVSVNCEETGVNWKFNCWDSIVCTGDAVVWGE